MDYVSLGRTDLRISKVGLGTWQIGSSYWGWGKEFDRERAIRVIQTAIEVGINLIDTAEAYGGGLSEEVVGEAVRDVREDVVIATKVSPAHLTYRGVKKALERSLRRLGTDYVDLYQVHWPNPLIPIGQTMRAMEELLEEGKIRAIGVSNFSLRRLEAAREALKKHDVSSNQVEYSILKRGAERELLPYCRREGITLIAYSPLAQGLLTGKYGPGRMPRGLQRRVWTTLLYGTMWKIASVLFALKEISEGKSVTIPQVAIAWVIRHPEVVAIPGAKSEDQVKQNAEAVNVKLEERDLRLIEEALRF